VLYCELLVKEIRSGCRVGGGSGWREWVEGAGGGVGEGVGVGGESGWR